MVATSSTAVGGDAVLTAVATRPPAYAGSFYPADPDALRSLVADLLRESPRHPVASTDRLVAVLVPHAGLVYSGRIAALGWSAVGDAAPDSVVLLGTDHGGRADGVAVWEGDAWVGPFGSVAIDHALTRRILELGSPFVADAVAHLDEHSIEVQLPLMAATCPQTRAVMLSIGTRSVRAAREAGALLGRLLQDSGERDRPPVLVASSDFAHYPPAAVARDVDRRMLEHLLRLDAEGLWNEEVVVRGLRGVACGMCGIAPAAMLLGALQELGAEGTLLGHATSADVPPHDAGRTVGYAAVAFTRCEDAAAARDGMI
jgi:AmmeMemoRadiSam system protein B